MKDEVVKFGEGQVKRLGMLEYYTPELKEKLSNSTGSVKHTFTAKYGSDVATVTQHWDKSSKTENSFLNKYDISVQREGQAEPRTQTFYVPKEVKTMPEEDGSTVRYDNKYTLKEAYNLLAGRAVYKNLLSEKQEPYNAWVRRESEILPNGNHKLQAYNEKYGFKLEDVLKEYKIKGMDDALERAKLIDSLQRGNLQKATLINKDNKEQVAYVAVSIRTSSLDIFDENKKRIPLDRLVSEGVVSEKIVHSLKEIAEKARQKKEQTQSVSQTPVVVEQKRQIPGVKAAQNNGTAGQKPPKPKMARKPKVG